MAGNEAAPPDLVFKPLEWRKVNGMGVFSVHIADCVHRWIIYLKENGNFSVYCGAKRVGTSKTLPDAKNLAQQNHEDLIRTAILNQ